MKQIPLCLGLAALVGASLAHADDAYLRLRCDGEAAGAEVRINGVKKGECPVDLIVPEGKVKLSVRKALDEHRFKTFEKELFLSGGAMKRESVVLGPLQFTPEGQRLEDERMARENAEAEARAEKKRREDAAWKRRGLTQNYLGVLKNRVNYTTNPPETEGPITWSSFVTMAPAYLPMSTLSDLSSGKDVFAKAADPAAFANPESMMGRVVQQQATY
jgi:hypothetical protein